MKFMDFTMKDLIGKPVLWIRAGEGRGTVKMITSIESTDAEGFKIVGGEDKVFAYANGHQKATSGRMTSIVSVCELVTAEEIAAIRAQWQEVKRKKMEEEEAALAEHMESVRKTRAELQNKQKNVAEEIRKEHEAMLNTLDRTKRLQAEMAELEDKLQDHNRILSKHELVKIIKAHPHKLNALSQEQLQSIVDSLNIK